MKLDESNGLDLRALGINRSQAADLRRRLKTFAEDWERPEANIYDKVASQVASIDPHRHVKNQDKD